MRTCMFDGRTRRLLIIYYGIPEKVMFKGESNYYVENVCLSCKKGDRIFTSDLKSYDEKARNPDFYFGHNLTKLSSLEFALFIHKYSSEFLRKLSNKVYNCTSEVVKRFPMAAVTTYSALFNAPHPQRR